MRFLLLPVAFALALGGLTARADPTEDEETPEALTNQAWCQATFSGYGHQHVFTGWSEYFGAGSGLGQQRRQQGCDRAMQRCQDGYQHGYYYGHYSSCYCSPSQCWIEQH